MKWVIEHSVFLNTMICALMLMVWIVYLQLLLNGYRRQRRSSILITRGAGTGLRARCLITNMSAEPIYVTSLVAAIITNEGRTDIQLTDLRDLPEDLGIDPRSAMRQGSLETSRYIDLGHFDDLISQMADKTADELAETYGAFDFELTVLALYGSEEMPVGSKRVFSIDKSRTGQWRVTPTTITTKQLRTNRERRALLKKIADLL